MNKIKLIIFLTLLVLIAWSYKKSKLTCIDDISPKYAVITSQYYRDIYKFHLLSRKLKSVTNEEIITYNSEFSLEEVKGICNNFAASGIYECNISKDGRTITLTATSDVDGEDFTYKKIKEQEEGLGLTCK